MAAEGAVPTGKETNGGFWGEEFIIMPFKL
jgi:hypothetical protein